MNKKTSTKNAVITGGNTGIGLEMALAFAGMGHRVLIGARSEDKNRAAVARVKQAHPQADIEALPLDLGDFANVDRFAAEVLRRMPTIDLLMLNAGLYTMKPYTLPNGLEAMIGVMHFGHFRLTQHLLDAVKNSEQGRIVVTSSVGHHFGRIDEGSFTDPSKHLLAFNGYGQAKLANLLFTRELARRLQGTRVTVNAFHPGGVATEIWRETPGFFKRVALRFMLTPAQGADTAIWLATSPEVAGVSGEYFIKRRRKRGNPASRNTGTARHLWDLSEAICRKSPTAVPRP